MRRRAAEAFSLDYAEMDERHHLTFGTYELGRLDLEEYLKRVVFYKERSFTLAAFKSFMFAQSEPIPQMIDLVGRLKALHDLKVIAVSNEARELTIHRIERFNLRSVIDFFISSCFVHFRKPDLDIYLLALDCAQVRPEEVAYIDDRRMFVEVASTLGIHSIWHTAYEATRTGLEALGLSMDRSRHDQ
jgi:putative hydrolase of the HAD superfamily